MTHRETAEQSLAFTPERTDVDAFGEIDTLLLIAHGSSETDASASSAAAHARQMLRWGRFDDVRVAFVNGRPSIERVLTSIEAGRVVVVPMFGSDGYVSGTVVPEAVERARRPSVSVQYAEPVGTHPLLTAVIESRAKKAMAPVEELDDTGSSTAATLAVVGHGSTRSPSNRVNLCGHAARIERRCDFDAIRVFFLDEQPLVGSLPDHIDGSRCVIVPFFMGDGYHVREDIPDRLGISTGSRESWTSFGGRKVWYTRPVGTHPLVARIVLERALEVEKTEEPGGQAPRRDPPMRKGEDTTTVAPGGWR